MRRSVSEQKCKQIATRLSSPLTKRGIISGIQEIFCMSCNVSKHQGTRVRDISKAVTFEVQRGTFASADSTIKGKVVQLLQNIAPTRQVSRLVLVRFCPASSTAKFFVLRNPIFGHCHLVFKLILPATLKMTHSFLRHQMLIVGALRGMACLCFDQVGVSPSRMWDFIPLRRVFGASSSQHTTAHTDHT